MQHDAEPMIHSVVSGADSLNVLLLAESFHSSDDDVCFELLSPMNLSEINLLSVGFTFAASKRIVKWLRESGERPARLKLITSVEFTRSGGDGQLHSQLQVNESVVERIGSPNDLTELGVKVTKIANEWEATDEQTVVCVNSLTTLLQYAEIDRAYRFLHVFADKLMMTGAISHYHMDPSAHTPQTVNTLKQLFDVLIEVSPEGELVVSKRGGV